jgi:hypothetical protein
MCFEPELQLVLEVRALRLLRSLRQQNAVNVPMIATMNNASVWARRPRSLLDGLIWPEGEGLTPLASPQR